MSGGRKREIVAHVATLLDLLPGEFILEVGFGPGVGIKHVQRMVGEGGRVVGIDPSTVMLDQAKSRNVEAIHAGTVQLLTGTVERIPFPDRSFDKAYAMNSMQLWPDSHVGLKEVLRVLKDDGRLVLSFDGPARKVVTGESAEAILCEVGFRQVETREIGSTIYILGLR